MSKIQSPKSRKKEPIAMNRLAVVMKEERVTNRALAAEMGYEETTVSKWVTNAIQPPMATFYRIALLLNRDLPELFVSTNKLSETDKSAQLKVLAKMAQQGKRTGKDKK